MRVLITGGAGFLGRRLVEDAPDSVDLHATTRQEADLAERDAVDALFTARRPDVVIHTAYSAATGDRDIVLATANVAGACAAARAELIHLSSDVVFDGEHAPYAEDHPLLPVSVYGRWKAEAEGDVTRLCPGAAIVRTSLITWADPLDPRSAWVADTLRAGGRVTLFTDEVRCPIRLDDLSAMIWELVALDAADRAGPWHLVGPEAISRHELGVVIAEHAGVDTAGLTAGGSREQPEPRPRDLRLTTARADAALPTRARPVTTLFR